MACLAVNGYHSLSSYQWYKDGALCTDEETPLYYTTGDGTYTCEIVAIEDKERVFFKVSGINI